MRAENAFLAAGWGKANARGGLQHEVECGEALNLTTNERTEVVLLVSVEKEGNWKQSKN